MEQDIVQWSKQCEDEEQDKLLGALYSSLPHLTSPNQINTAKPCSCSSWQRVTFNKQLLKHCEILNHLILQRKLTQLLQNNYEEKSLGPARTEILDKGLSDIEQLTSILKKIPGRPRDVWIIGQSTDQIKLSWMPPEHNPDAVEEYVVYKKDQDGEWKEVARTKNTKALVKGLKWMTTHEFQVVATNSTVTSISSGETSESIFPTSLVSAAGVGAVDCMRMSTTARRLHVASLQFLRVLA